MAKLNDARRSLERARESAKSRLHQLDEERREIKLSLKSLELALKALGHKSAPPARLATTADVIAVTKKLLSVEGSMLKDDLLRSVSKRLRQLGFSAAGIDACFEEACVSDGFGLDDAGVVDFSPTSHETHQQDEGGSNVE